jgi:hypothetical protein
MLRRPCAAEASGAPELGPRGESTQLPRGRVDEQGMFVPRLLALALALIVACHASRPEPDPEAPLAGSAPPPPPPRGEEGWLAATTNEGAVVVLDPEGVVATTQPSAGYGGLFDLAARPTGLVSYEETDEGEGAELGLYAFVEGADGPSLGARQRLAWVDGIARVASTSAGLVIFEENQGTRWHLDREGMPPLPSVECPRPASLATFAGFDGDHLVALSSPFPFDAPVERVEVVASSTGLGPCVRTVLTDLPAAPRLLRTSSGRELAFGTRLGHVHVARLDGPLALPVVELPVAAASVEAVLPSGDDDALVLTTGPSRLTRVRLGGQEAPSVDVVSSVALPGEARSEQQFFSRELALLGRRAFVATGAGVVAFDLGDDALTEVPLPASASLLRGPLIPLAPSPWPRAPASP